MSIHLAQALQARWAANDPLQRLLPAERVFTGLPAVGLPAAPWATISLAGGTLEAAANDGTSVDCIKVVIHIRHDDYEQGSAASDAVRAAFDRCEFPLAGAARVICMQREGLPQEFLDPQHGLWTWQWTFLCRVWW